ncbi:MAG TPA: HAD family phosphatase [Candidatus Saccharimonadales bacterium]|nr:HAD family phosphatase [Candidatus Saccharimonadales bacterium]
MVRQDIRCFIFDLDGTLVFNERANFLAYRAAFKTAGLDLSEGDFVGHFRNGGNIEEIFKDFTTTHHLPYDPAVLQRIKTSKVGEYAKRFRLIEENTPIVRLLQALAPHYHTALATTGREENARPLLDAFGLTPFFHYLVFGGDVTHKKPDPECHHAIAVHFGVRPDQCLIFEDSPKGFAAAEAFGAHIVKVTP